MNGFDFSGRQRQNSERQRICAGVCRFGDFGCISWQKATGSETASDQISATEAARALLEESISAVKTVQDVPEQLIQEIP